MQNCSDGLFLLKLIKRRIAESAIIQGSINLDTRDKFFQNALYWAITYQRVNDTKLLLKYGISQNIAPHLDALAHALIIDNQEILALFENDEEMVLSA